MKHLILLILFSFLTLSLLAQDCGDVSFEILNSSNIPVYGNCVNSTINNSLSLIGTPEGGFFSGEGITDNILDASVLTPGIYEISYMVEINGTECSFSQPFNILPETSFSVLASNGMPTETVCSSNVDTLNLEGSEIIGVFYGDGVDEANGTFIPSLAECGENEISYFTIIDGIDCETTTSIYTSCVYLTDDTIPNNNIILFPCWNNTDNINSDNVNHLFINHNVSDGEITFEPDGISFDEENGQILSIENEGSYTLYFSTDINGEECINSFDFEVTFIPELYFTMDTVFCLNDEAVEITGNQMINGINTLAYLKPINETDQISVEYLNPAFWGIGEYELTYYHVDLENACSNTFTQNIYIIDDPAFNLTATTINTSDEPILLEATPNYGTFSGNGVVVIDGDYYFDPALSSGGNFDITYTLSEFDPCGPMTLTQNIAVIPGVNTQDWDNNFQVNVYPNHIQINSDQLINEPLQIELYNIQGQKVYQAQYKDLQQIQIPLPEQKNQLYVLSITSNNERFIRTISLIK